METLILGWYVLVDTGSVLLLTAFASLPFLGTLATPMFGVVGDRLGGRALLCAMRAGYVLLAAVLSVLALAGLLTPSAVFVVAAIAGIVALRWFNSEPRCRSLDHQATTGRLLDTTQPRRRFLLPLAPTRQENVTTTMRYAAPETLQSAVSLLASANGDARVLAGGTDLLVQIRSDVLDPELIVDIKKIPDTRSVTEERGGWRVGAAVTGAELNEHPRLKKMWPGVVEAANLIGSTQIQGRATLGGNLGNGSPAADSVPALIAAGAVATVAGPDGKRDIPVEDVMLGPRKLSLRRGEFIVSFLLPPQPPRSADAYLRFIPRTEMDIAVVGAGVNVTLDGSGVITAARVSLGAVAERVLLVADAARAIIGSTLDHAAQQRLEAAARAACRPIDDKRGTVQFRTEVAGVLARRAALIARERARNA